MSDSRTSEFIERIPVGPLALMPLQSIETLGERVNRYLAAWRAERESEHKHTIAFNGYQKDNYIVPTKISRFGTGEAKGEILETVRGVDIYFLVDVMNYSITYSIFGHVNHMSPDDHYADLKRLIAATTGKAKRINVIMPFMYESRQHKRSGRESLDCAMMLQELHSMGVENFITFDAHDPRVMNAIPRDSFDNVSCSYQFIKALLQNVPDLDIDKDHMMIISPDEGGMKRAIYYANVLGLDMGMFYKRRDYTQVVNGRNPIVAHEFLGSDVAGKDVIIIDDMISSGESLIDTAKALKERRAKRVYACCTFGLFTNGLNKFDEACAARTLDGVLTTDLIYQTPELLSRKWYIGVGMAKYVALLIDNMNHDMSISAILDPVERINERLQAYRKKRAMENEQISMELE
ncbi:ribose-phosphate diphosphokinase [Oribacterium sp. oral taxon 078 str. F0263]|uniref:ribose-phosphate pyrophosphokinase n=1 Tax=Oribacterium sp. oral taxon 078 TaxID=652706 RepID=UPI0001BCBC11|nr:ribose-phosphate pyrophosphokinase [Oribacterium sp. oral taxon 078]EFE90391.1 ribose-phosphate diphosphokinase [Oribacterium sp. oral taxon 078 str. F0262]ERL21928.1 ribose-phosphate diphosphokinase [Oribacterium sp. oral taxon 078 str. F0263]